MLEPPQLAPTIVAIPLAPREALHCLGRMEFQKVQLAATQPGMRPRDLDNSGRRDLTALMGRLGIACAGIDFLIPPGHYVDAVHADRAASAAMAAIELAADLGRVVVTMHLPEVLAKPDPDKDHADLLAAIRAHADRFGVDLAHLGDPVLRPEGLGVAIDLAALTLKGISASAALGAAGDALRSVRCSGATEAGARIPFGPASRVDPLELQVALSIAGYRTPVVLDARGWPEPIAGLQDSSAAWSRAAPFQSQ